MKCTDGAVVVNDGRTMLATAQLVSDCCQEGLRYSRVFSRNENVAGKKAVT